MKSFAIVLVCYNRLPGLKRLLSSLERANYQGRNDVTLIFSIDNSGSDLIEKFAENYVWSHGNKVIRTFPERQGLKNHILQCGDFTEQYDIVTVLEDDIFVSDSFFAYANTAAEYYWDDEKIAGISLYSFQKHWLNWFYRFEPQSSCYDTFFMKIAQSWGQVWTGPKWAEFKKWLQNNKEFTYSDKIPDRLNYMSVSSWFKYHCRYCIECNKYFVYPYRSLSTDFTDAGEHSKATTSEYQVELQCGKNEYAFAPFTNDAVVYDEYMERECLGDLLGISNQELSVDLYGTRRENLYKRFLLSLEDRNYEIIKTFGLELRPIELNILYGIEGDVIKLYDRTKTASNKNRTDSLYHRMVYSMRYNGPQMVFKYSIKVMIHNLWRIKNITGRIRRKFAKH